MNNINSLEEIKVMVMKPFHHTFANTGGIENHIDKTMDMIKEIITTHEQQARRDFVMRLPDRYYLPDGSSINLRKRVFKFLEENPSA